MSRTGITIAILFFLALAFVGDLTIYPVAYSTPRLWGMSKMQGKRNFAFENSVPDDKTKTRPQDVAKVNVNEKYELAYWSQKFGVTPDQLRAG